MEAANSGHEPIPLKMPELVSRRDAKRLLEVCYRWLKDVIDRKTAGPSSSFSLLSASVFNDQSLLRRVKDTSAIIGSIIENLDSFFCYETSNTYASDAISIAKNTSKDSDESNANNSGSAVSDNLDTASEKKHHTPSARYTFLSDAMSVVSLLKSYVWNQQRSTSWKDVDAVYHEAYSCSCVILSLLKVFQFEEHYSITNSSNANITKNLSDHYSALTHTTIELIIKDLDFGILMGSPSLSQTLNDLISILGKGVVYSTYRKRKLDLIGLKMMSSGKKNRTEIRQFIGQLFSNPQSLPAKDPRQRRNIKRVHSIDLLSFYNSHMLPMEPVIITGAIEDWPAMNDTSRSWNNLDYLIERYGDRLVPVEVGAHYLAEDSRQCIISLSQFIHQYLCKVSDGGASSDETGYLAQHKLFDQIPELRFDISTPDYCALVHPDDDSNVTDEDYSKNITGRSERKGVGGNYDALDGNDDNDDHFDDDDNGDGVHINAWLGPDTSVSPIHHDPYFNLLAQVVGHKYVRLYSSSESANMYPMEGRSSNSSQVDLTRSPEEISSCFGAFDDAKYCEGVLGPGEMLFIPRWHWHFIAALNEQEMALYYKNQPHHHDSISNGSGSNINSNINSSCSSSSSGSIKSKSHETDSIVQKSGKNNGESPSYSFSVNFWWGKRIEKKQ